MKTYKNITSNKFDTEIHAILLNELRDKILEEIFYDIKIELFDGIFKELYLKIQHNLNRRY